MAKNVKTGRPPFKPTPAQRKRVAIAASAGMAHEEIAIGLGIHRHTLEKYFAFELSTGAYQKRIEVFEAMHKAAKAGNVSAQKALAAMSPALSAPPLPDEPGDKPGKAPGKKAQADADARTAQHGTDWDGLLTPTSSLQ